MEEITSVDSEMNNFALANHSSGIQTIMRLIHGLFPSIDVSKFLLGDKPGY